MRIAIIGMMGTMKSSVAKELAVLKKMQLFDTDDLFTATFGNISQYFEQFGEKSFREKEAEIFANLCAQDNIIISCGGGLPTVQANKELLTKCFVVCLTSSPEVIFSRLRGDSTRPLLKDNSVDKIAQIMAQRAADYTGSANITINTDGKTPREVAISLPL